MLITTGLETEPKIDPSAQKLYSGAYETMVDQLRWVYDRTAFANGLVCIEAVREWLKHKDKFPGLQLEPLSVVFNGPVINVRTGRTERGQDTLLISHPDFPDTRMVADVAGYLFGFSTIDEMPAAVGSRPFVEDRLTRLYEAKHPGIVVSIPDQVILGVQPKVKA